MPSCSLSLKGPSKPFLHIWRGTIIAHLEGRRKGREEGGINSSQVQIPKKHRHSYEVCLAALDCLQGSQNTRDACLLFYGASFPCFEGCGRRESQEFMKKSLRNLKAYGMKIMRIASIYVLGFYNSIFKGESFILEKYIQES